MMHSLLIDEPPLQVLPALVKAVGFSEAVVLQEVHYQLQSKLVDTNLKNGHRWVPNLAGTCAIRYHFWDVQVIERIILQLERTGILLVSDGVPPCHTIDYDLLHLMAEIPLKAVHLSMDELHTEGANTNRSFLFKIKVQQTATNSYVMKAENISHFLACELKLEIKTNCQRSQVICHFPRVSSRKIRKACEQVHIVYNIIMILFQASTLDQLLIFCIKQGASNLVIVPNSSSQLSFYQEFLRGLGLAKDKKHTEMMIPAVHDTRLKLTRFVQEACSNLKIALRAAQKTNPRIAALVSKLLPGFLESSS